MKPKKATKPLSGSAHAIPRQHKLLGETSSKQVITVTLYLRRRKNASKLLGEKDFTSKWGSLRPAVDHQSFADKYGADPAEIQQVIDFARESGLDVKETNPAARSVVVQGAAAKLNSVFGVKLQNYQGELRKYHNHAGEAHLPSAIANLIETVSGLDNRPIRARAYNTSRRRTTSDPANTKPVTPQEIAQLYAFPPGDGAGQTIGIYEMAVEDPQTNKLADAGYKAQDVAKTIQGFGGNLKVPKIIDVSIDGVGNSGVNDGETLLDITVAGAIAQAATIVVYFTGPEPQNILHALQRMIHPLQGDPMPNIISISYGWGPDEETGFSEGEINQFGALFQDAANLFITVLVSSGDSGCYLGASHAQVSYPASEPMVTACGGTTVGNVSGANFDEYAWNDVGAGGPGATGGGISAIFQMPSYQNSAGVPKNNSTKKAGRGIPDLAGNASENSGYMQQASGFRTQPVGGTSAVAPLYAGLFARINSNLGSPAGFVNPVIYSLGAAAFRDTVAPPGPLNNSFNGVTGYPVTKGWDACTGWGSVNGLILQNGLKTAKAGSKTTT
jgi:kumamolisin